MALVEQHPRNIPDSYPSQLEELVTTESGLELWIRPLVPSDAAALTAEFAEADEDTLYMRFFTPSFDLTDERLRYLTEIDYKNHVALAAMTAEGDESQGVAIARYVARSATDVEGAIVVKERYRRLGIGTLLLDRLIRAAGAAGYQTMSGTYLSANVAVEHLLERSGFQAATDEEDGTVNVIVAVDREAGPPPGR